MKLYSIAEYISTLDLSVLLCETDGIDIDNANNKVEVVNNVIDKICYEDGIEAVHGILLIILMMTIIMRKCNVIKIDSFSTKCCAQGLRIHSTIISLLLVAITSKYFLYCIMKFCIIIPYFC